MDTTNRRRNLRIPLERMVEVNFGDSGSALHRSRDVSLAGIFLHAANQPQTIAPCTLTLRECWANQQVAIRLVGRIIRREPHGLALLFTEMNRATRILLQTLLLYQSSDPVAMGEDFAHSSTIPRRNWCHHDTMHAKRALGNKRIEK